MKLKSWQKGGIIGLIISLSYYANFIPILKTSFLQPIISILNIMWWFILSIFVAPYCFLIKLSNNFCGESEAFFLSYLGMVIIPIFVFAIGSIFGLIISKLGNKE